MSHLKQAPFVTPCTCARDSTLCQHPAPNTAHYSTAHLHTNSLACLSSCATYLNSQARQGPSPLPPAAGGGGPLSDDPKSRGSGARLGSAAAGGEIGGPLAARVLPGEGSGSGYLPGRGPLSNLELGQGGGRPSSRAMRRRPGRVQLDVEDRCAQGIMPLPHPAGEVRVLLLVLGAAARILGY